MRILVLLPNESLSRLQAAIGRSMTIVRVTNDAALLSTLSTASPVAVMVDPMLVPPTRMAKFAKALRRSQVPVVVYLSVSASSVKAGVDLMRVSSEVILRGFDDSPQELRRVVGALPEQTVTSDVLTRLAPALGALPDPLRDAIVAMFVRADGSSSPDDLAAAAGMTRRSLDRWMARAGFASARLLVAAPRVIRAYGHLRGSDTPISWVSSMLGYGSPRSLEQQCRGLLGVRANALRRHVDPDRFVTALQRHLVSRKRWVAYPWTDQQVSLPSIYAQSVGAEYDD